MNKQYNFYSDDGHGWVAVKRKELLALGIADKISSYSFVKGDTVYLEEDGDLNAFVNAKNACGDTIEWNEVYHQGRSWIRGLARYEHTPVYA